jgi:hypothetical protein
MKYAAAVALLGLAGCLHPVHDVPDYDPIPGVEEGAGMQQVLNHKDLGRPDSRATGWWVNEHSFNQNYVVWYYREKGRVIFDGPKSMTVVTSESDASEDGRPN